MSILQIQTLRLKWIDLNPAWDTLKKKRFKRLPSFSPQVPFKSMYHNMYQNHQTTEV